MSIFLEHRNFKGYAARSASPAPLGSSQQVEKETVDTADNACPNTQVEKETVDTADNACPNTPEQVCCCLIVLYLISRGIWAEAQPSAGDNSDVDDNDFDEDEDVAPGLFPVTSDEGGDSDSSHESDGSDTCYEGDSEDEEWENAHQD